MKALKIVKIGGQILDDPQKLDKVINAFAKLKSPKILVHGGGREATEYSKKIGIEPEIIDGRRITDAESLKIVQMVYAGLINKNIVARLQALNCSAIGLSGADANCILAKKRKVKNVDYGFVGDVVQVNTSVLIKILNCGLTPVFCALTHDRKGQILNTNADTIATELSIAFSPIFAVDLLFCFEQNGVLSEPGNQNSLITNLSLPMYQRLKNEGKITAGMIPKLDNAFRAVTAGVRNIYIAHFDEINKLELKNNKMATQISAN